MMTITQLKDNTFETEVLQEKDKSVLVDFWAEWCGPCRMMASVIESLDKKYGAQLKVCKLDTDQNPKTSEQYQITGIPCCILFKDGKEVSRFVGYRAEDAFANELKQHLSI